MPTSNIVNEVNASAGPVGTTYRLTLTTRDPAVRVNHGPSRTATLTNLGGGTLRQATVANDGTYGAFADLAVGATQTVTTADRVFITQGVDSPVAVSIVIS